MEEGNLEIPEKNLGKDENQLQSQPIYDACSGNRAWVTLVSTVTTAPPLLHKVKDKQLNFAALTFPCIHLRRDEEILILEQAISKSAFSLFLSSISGKTLNFRRKTFFRNKKTIA